jgi:hypothetical protein
MDTDEVIAGQWLKARVYTRRCDVSPDGEYVVIAASDYASKRKRHDEYPQFESWEKSGWTAISRVPYFTAVGLWFSGGAWNGGGLWKSSRHVELNPNPHHHKQAKTPPKRLKVGNLRLPPSEDEPLFTLRLQRDGWKKVREERTVLLNPGYLKESLKFAKSMMTGDFMADGDLEAFTRSLEAMMPKWKTEQTGIQEKPFATGLLRREVGHAFERWTLLDLAGNQVRTWEPKSNHPQFLDIDTRGRVVFGDLGCLWTWEDFPNGRATLIADLNPNKYQPLAAPPWASAD